MAAMFLWAVSGSMASARVIGVRSTGKTAFISPRGASGWTLPASARTGTPWAGESGHSSRSLAHGGLAIELSLTGEAEVAAREKSCQAGLLQDDGSTGAQFCPQKGGKAKAQPTGSAAAGKIRVTAGEGGSGLFGKPPDGGIQPGDHLLAGAFLRP